MMFEVKELSDAYVNGFSHYDGGATCYRARIGLWLARWFVTVNDEY